MFLTIVVFFFFFFFFHVLVLFEVIIVLLIAFYLCTAFGEIREVAVITRDALVSKIRTTFRETTDRKHSMSPPLNFKSASVLTMNNKAIF
jgi:hypothetical protein